uniref:Uncharacterized protein n=1 Tax=Arundo donax TaxID=35708 RepID=A0A0A8ZJG6_ARUDO
MQCHNNSYFSEYLSSLNSKWEVDRVILERNKC